MKILVLCLLKGDRNGLKSEQVEMRIYLNENGE